MTALKAFGSENVQQQYYHTYETLSEIVIPTHVLKISKLISSNCNVDESNKNTQEKVGFESGSVSSYPYHYSTETFKSKKVRIALDLCHCWLLYGNSSKCMYLEII